MKMNFDKAICEFRANLATMIIFGLVVAIDFIKGQITDLKPKYDTAKRELVSKQKKLDEVRGKLNRNSEDADILAMSILFTEQENLARKFEELEMHYSLVLSELTEIERKQKALDIPIHVGKSVSQLSQLKYEVADVLAMMNAIWTGVIFPESYYTPSEHSIKFGSKTAEFAISDVRGDGACGTRAFLTGLCRILFGFNLPYDPDGMIGIIARVKKLMVSLLDIINSDQRNREFINYLIHNPDNKGLYEPTFDGYKHALMDNRYYFTNDEFRILIILFNMVEPRISQVNIIRKERTSHEVYQSITPSGNTVQVANSHINILKSGCHFMYITHLTEGVLPIIFQPPEDIFV